MPIDVLRRDALADWLRLSQTPGVGPIGFARLLAAVGDPTAVRHAKPAALADTVGPQVAAAITGNVDPAREARVQATLEWAAADDRHLVTLADADYPALLREIPDPPPVLHVGGQRQRLGCPMVAVVGSRNATAVGRSNAQAFARALSEAGLTVASGLALGIDAAAHEGSLAGGAGTVAVLGTGIDRIYPAANLGLARRILADGVIVSELPLGTRAATGTFPRRNRLIAGLAAGVLVVEAALESGSLITARLAADFGREVFAIPGSIHSPLARGCHRLIRQGAQLVENIDDILPELGHNLYASTRLRYKPPCAGGESLLLKAIGHDPVLPDTLALQLALPVPELAAALLQLELDGAILRLSDGRLQRTLQSG